MIRRFLVVVLVLLVPAITFAKRQKVAAKAAASVRATASETAKEVVKVKAGDQVTVLSTKGEWVNVATTAGKKGWLPLKVVPDAKSATTVSTGSADTTIAAAEGSTATAMRGRPAQNKTRILLQGDSDAVAQLREALAKNPKVEVVEQPVVVQVTKAADGSLSYTVLDTRAGGAIDVGTAAKPAASIDQIATDVGALAAPTATP